MRNLERLWQSSRGVFVVPSSLGRQKPVLPSAVEIITWLGLLAAELALVAIAVAINARNGLRSLLGHIRLEQIIAGLLLVAAAPFYVLIAIAIVVESGMPIFFWQSRLGKGGRPFNMCKFRKFGAYESPNGCPLTMANDKRLTRVGRVLEKTKLDEIPQLWNIARGEMSFVGPRPESMRFADCFTGEFERVLDYTPGILGPSQIKTRNEALLYPACCDPEQFYREVLFPVKARTDLDYYAHRTVMSDLGWIVQGAAAVVGRCTAVSVEERQQFEDALPDIRGR